MTIFKSGENLKVGNSLLYWYTPTPIIRIGARFLHKSINRYCRVAYFAERPAMTIIEDDIYKINV